MPAFRVTAGNLTQLGEVISGGSYLSQSDLRLHFGLANHERVDAATILWPDGTTETLKNLAADRFLHGGGRELGGRIRGARIDDGSLTVENRFSPSEPSGMLAPPGDYPG